MAELLFWPALFAYGEAAVAYASVRTTRAATWGVRLGWLAQTALLAAQVVGTDGDFPWSSWAGTLNLFVWFLVGTYLIWGCRPKFRLLGLTVMPLAASLFLVARIGGGTNARSSHYGDLFLVLHVGMLTAAFAGFTLAAGLAALYLWQEHRLKGRAPDILKMRLPPLASLEFLAWRTILVSGITVLVAMAGMFLSGDKTFMSFSVGAMIVVAVVLALLLVLGGGYIGLEFGQMFHRFGSAVTVIHQHEQILPREDERGRRMATKEGDAPRLAHFRGVCGTDDEEMWNRAQHRELFDGLVRGAIFAESDGVVREDVDDLHFRETREADRWLHVIGEAHERAAVRDETAVQTDTRQRRAHRVLAYAEVEDATIV